jgi:hypothetical protein
VVQELREEMKEKGGFKANLDPKKANYLDHDLLFGELPNDIKLKPTSSPLEFGGSLHKSTLHDSMN